ncbi:MAG: SurA N-terminal domain-containing protein [Alphaproteobacteria bacterium]|nr:SurA N-terminal domain-containing protein [Alphaproteobacteria bacterium]
MLRGIRKASSNWIGKTIMTIVMGLLIVAFGFWGIADIFRGFGQSTLATIGHTEISVTDFRDIYTNRLREIGRQQGRPLTPEQARKSGIDRMILNQTIDEATLDETISRLGLAQSDAQIENAILSDPRFRNAAGVFDQARYEAMLYQMNTRNQRYRADLRQQGLRQQMMGSVIAGLEPSKTLVTMLTRYLTEERRIDYITLGSAVAGDIPAPTDEVLKTYFATERLQFSAPEYRSISFLTINPEEVAKTITIADSDARAQFARRKDSLSKPERRQVHRILFPSMEEAAAARARLTQGLSFDALATERGADPADANHGLVTKADILDPVVADAAFALHLGEISQPIQGMFGVALVKVDEIEPGREASYDDVANDMKHELALEKAATGLTDLRNRMEDEHGAGSSVIESAQKLGLTAVTIDAVDRSGRGPDGQLIAAIPAGLDLVAKAFDSKVSMDNDPISFRGGYVWFDVLSVTAPRERELAEVRSQVEERWRQTQIAQKLREKAAELRQQLKDGRPMNDVATGIGVRLETSPPLTRSGKTELPRAVLAAVFKTARDSIGQATVDDRIILFRVTDITEPAVDPASETSRNMRLGLLRVMNDEQMSAFVRRLSEEIGFKINESAFDQVTGANQQ